MDSPSWLIDEVPVGLGRKKGSVREVIPSQVNLLVTPRKRETAKENFAQGEALHGPKFQKISNTFSPSQTQPKSVALDLHTYAHPRVQHTPVDKTLCTHTYTHAEHI